MTNKASFVWYDELAPFNWDAWDKLLIDYNKCEIKVKNMNTEQHFCDTISVEELIQNTKDRNGELYRYMQSQAKVIADLRSRDIGYETNLHTHIQRLINRFGFNQVITELAKRAPR